MQFAKLVLRNALRHKLRTALTVLGLVVAITSFGLLQTVVGAWYAGAESAAPTRLVTRNAVSLVFPLPLGYRDKIRSVDGVRSVSYANWFAGIYQDPKNFFPQLAVEPRTYFDMYRDYLVPADDFVAFLRDRKGAVIGRKLADTHRLKVGDVMPLRGTIYPGTWEFTIRAIYDGAEQKTDTSQMFFHWDYLNETVKKRGRGRADQVGIYLVDVTDADRAAEVSQAIDALFRNSLAETLTETERAFQIGFVKQTEALVVAIRIVSYVVIAIILAVMANTMAMTARERLAEYATLKALGFGPAFVARLILAESVAIALAGGLIALVATPVVAAGFFESVGKSVFARFEVQPVTFAWQMAAALAVGALAALVPMIRSANVRIVDGLRHVG